MLKKMTDLAGASFADFVRTNEFAVIHFWAIWNHQDQTMKDIIEDQLAARKPSMV